MSSSNVMEVISKGRDVYNASDSVTESVSRCSSTSQSTRTESQLSLEYLPPEAPYYGSVAISPQPPEDYTLSQDSDQEAPPVCRPTDQLYQRIQALSDQIHSELDTLIDIESVSSQQQTPIPVDVDSMRESLQELSALRDSPPTPDECTSVTSNTDTNECRDLVCISDSEMAKDLDCGSTDSATPAPRPSSDQSIVHSDPKLKKAFDKMKKLDEKLADLEKKEKEVKRQRKLLEQQMENESRESVSVTSVHSLDRELYSPVFTTQLSDVSSTARDRCHPVSKGKVNKNERVKQERKETEEAKTRSKVQTEIAGTNFIKRNIELASDAGALVAMTEAEKQRLAELVGGEEEETEDETEDIDPLSVVVVRDPQEGFGHNQDDVDRMRVIDSKLLAIPPPSDWESTSCPSRIDCDQLSSEELQQTSYVATDLSSDVPGEVLEVSKDRGLVAMTTSPGNGVLHQLQISGDDQERLASMLGAIREESQLVTPLSQSDLQTLLEQCRQSEHAQADGQSDIQGLL